MSESCGDDHCVTCADEGIPVRVVDAGREGLAVCADAAGSATEVMTDLVGPVSSGDTLLVHAGVAIARLE